MTTAICYCNGILAFKLPSISYNDDESPHHSENFHPGQISPGKFPPIAITTQTPPPKKIGIVLCLYVGIAPWGKIVRVRMAGICTGGNYPRGLWGRAT